MGHGGDMAELNNPQIRFAQRVLSLWNLHGRRIWVRFQ